MDPISIDDFEKLDIRVGTVIDATVPEWSHWVMKLEVDFGPSFAKATEGKRYRTIFAGIMKFYSPKDLIGKQFPFVVNMKPKKIGPEGDTSNGMMLAACDETKEEKPTLFKLSKKVPNGAKVR